MELRSHPLMIHYGVRNWPPVWQWIGGPSRIDAGGEIGVLREVHASSIEPADHFFIIVSHKRCDFMACVAFDDASFCRQMFQLFKANLGRTIEEIGGVDLSFTL